MFYTLSFQHPSHFTRKNTCYTHQPKSNAQFKKRYQGKFSDPEGVINNPFKEFFQDF